IDFVTTHTSENFPLGIHSFTAKAESPLCCERVYKSHNQQSYKNHAKQIINNSFNRVPFNRKAKVDAYC
ncbi:MAG: hypothetical protein ACI4EG_03260, partial [Fusicatenibacter sp.]